MGVPEVPIKAIRIDEESRIRVMTDAPAYSGTYRKVSNYGSGIHWDSDRCELFVTPEQNESIVDQFIRIRRKVKLEYFDYLKTDQATTYDDLPADVVSAIQSACIDPFFLFNWAVAPKGGCVTELRDYKGDPELRLVCDPDRRYKPAQKKRIIHEWCEFFQSPRPVRVLSAGEIPIPLFEAICNQTQLEQLYFRSRSVWDLSPIAKLTKLARLSFECGKIGDLAPLAKLKSLKMLGIRGAVLLSDYSPLGKLRELEYLSIFGSGNKPARFDSLNFLSKLKLLRKLNIGHARMLAKDWHRPVMKLKNLDELHLPTLKDPARDSVLKAVGPLILHNLK
jgi:hypothetical protein